MVSSSIGLQAPPRSAVLTPEARTLSAVLAAHFVSHIFYLALPPLFPLMRERLGLGFVELGLALTVFNAVTVVLQMPVGFLVDRLGGRTILAVGLLLGGAAFIAMGLHPTYPVILVGMAVAGVGNCAYHPANYSLMAGAVPPERVGRAFSLHLFAGYLGTAVAPAGMLLFAMLFGLSGALIAAGLLAPLAALTLLLVPAHRHDAPAAAGDVVGPASRSSIFTPLILSLTGFFVLFSLSLTGINNFSVAALTAGAHLPLGFATTILSAYLIMSAVGILAGGVLADRTARHGAVSAVGFLVNGLLVGAVALVPMGGWTTLCVLAVAGFLAGTIQPSRDMIVRAACPPGAAGRVFGVVTTGFNVGAAIGPLIFGAALDHGHPMLVFGLTAVVMAVTACASVLAERWHATRA